MKLSAMRVVDPIAKQRSAPARSAPLRPTLHALRLTAALSAVALALCAPHSAAHAAAPDYPTRPIRFIVPFPPGGGNDIVGRIVALKLGDALGQQVVVDNRGGAGGTIGTAIAAQAPADGYTMLINNVSLAVNVTLMKKLPYDTLKDLAPVTLIGRQPNLLVVYPGFPAHSVQELLAMARAKPGSINYGSGGIGTASHLATELLKMMTHVELVHIPYKGLGPALTDLMGGRLQMIISTMASALPHVKAGKLRPLAVTTAKRTQFFPELPTMDEAGVKGYEFSTWYMLVVPAGVPAATMGKLNATLAQVLRSDVVKSQFAAQGLEPTPSSAAEASRYLRSEIAKWGKVIRASGAKAD